MQYLTCSRGQWLYISMRPRAAGDNSCAEPYHTPTHVILLSVMKQVKQFDSLDNQHWREEKMLMVPCTNINSL